MRLAFVTFNGKLQGGSEKLWVKTAHHALRNGHNVLVSLYKTRAAVNVVRSFQNTTAKTVLRQAFYPTLFFRIIKKINNLLPGKYFSYHNYLIRFKPDLIFFNLPGGSELVSNDDIYNLLIDYDITVVIFYHSIPSIENKPSKKLIERFEYYVSRCSVNYFTSLDQKRRFENYYGIDISNYRVLNHPLAENEKPKTIKTRGQGVIMFLMIASLVTRWKGQDTVIQILGSEKWKARNWKLCLVGDGEDRSYLEGLVETVGIKDKVSFEGIAEDVTYYYQRADIFLVPSKHDSGPIVLFEALMHKLPIVANPIGSCLEYVENNRTGMLAKSFEKSDFEVAMESAFLQKGYWNQWGEAGYELLQKKYDFTPWSTCLKQLKHITDEGL